MNNVTSEYTRILSSDIRNILKQLPHYQRPRGIIISNKYFTINDGELTTNMKLRRSTIISHFSSQINSLETSILNSMADQCERPSDFIEPVLLII